MNGARTNLSERELVEKPSGEVWTPTRWVVVVAFIFATHAALIFLFGEKKASVPRAITNVPILAFANDADEQFALNDPTLFALPNQRDFNSAIWFKMPGLKSPSFRWTEPPQSLPLSAEGLGAALDQFIQTNFIVNRLLDFRPTTTLTAPARPVDLPAVQNSTMQIEGELSQRQLPSVISLTNWPYADVIAPSKVQVLVDAAGTVVSAVLLPPENGLNATDYYDVADRRALEIARSLRFAPSSQPTIGQIIFNWHTVPFAPAVPPTASP